MLRCINYKVQSPSPCPSPRTPAPRTFVQQGHVEHSKRTIGGQVHINLKLPHPEVQLIPEARVVVPPLGDEIGHNAWDTMQPSTLLLADSRLWLTHSSG